MAALNPFANAFQDLDRAVAELDYVVNGEMYKRGYEELQQMKNLGNELENEITERQEHLEKLRRMLDDMERKVKNRKLVQALDRPPSHIRVDEWLPILLILQKWAEDNNINVKLPPTLISSMIPYWASPSLTELIQWLIKGVKERKATEPKFARVASKSEVEAYEKRQTE